MKGQYLILELNCYKVETWEISFKVKYDYPFLEMSEKYPGARISMWCVWDREMLHVPLNHHDLMSELEDYARYLDRAIDSFKETSDGIVLTMKCTCDLYGSIWNVAERNGCSIVHPATFLDGWGYFKVISFNENDAKGLFADLSKLGPNELLSKKLIHIDAVPSTIWVESFFERLTGKQVEALLKAYDYGYYTSPREVTTESIATSLGVSRSTYEEHLRKAENRIMESVVPYLKLFNSRGIKKKEMISSRIELVDS